MSINLNATTPSAPAGTVNIAWQVDGTGNVSANVPKGTSQVATVDSTAQTANIAATTLLAVTASGLFRVSGTIIVTSVGTTSTMPKVTLLWTDADNSTAQTLDVTATSAGNVLTTFAQFTTVIDAKTGTNIQYQTSGYASTGSAMQYALHVRGEQYN